MKNLLMTSQDRIFVTYSMGEPQVHKEEQEHIWSLVDGDWSVTSSEANLPILPKIALAAL